jgi:hypothetical protein
MDVHTLATDTLGNLMKENSVEVNSLRALVTWVEDNRAKDSPEMDALCTALIGADESEDESPARVEQQITRLTETLSVLSGGVPPSSRERAWLKEVVGDFSALLAHCVRVNA